MNRNLTEEEVILVITEMHIKTTVILFVLYQTGKNFKVVQYQMHIGM